MIEYIKGILVESSPLKTIIEAAGIGHAILTPISSYSKLPSIGEKICLFISTVIREDSHKHYGFLTAEERDLFETLIEVSGIGPKTALALLGHLEAADLQIAISQSDLSSICKVPGIGKKTAERLIVEMRDRFQKNSILFTAVSSSKDTPSFTADALRALVNLGYQPLQAQKAIQSALKENQEESDLGKLITSALRKL
ncbi:MAG: Holliday junction branch migration protein RuvA [Rhabdochlamydiaceae bacterium]|nr:Holliday junction branch migration protein RuvA [Rhabdochlamydiaceae bacterium]